MERRMGTASPWVERWIADAAPGPVLDAACGGGRHLRLFLSMGRRVTGIDRDVTGLSDLRRADGVEIVEADLENGDGWPLSAERRFAAVVVTNYLHRPLFPALIGALDDGGLLIYETFAVGNERFGRPRSPDFLLRAGELTEVAAAFGLTVLGYGHGWSASPFPAVTQRICAARGRHPLIEGPRVD